MAAKYLGFRDLGKRPYIDAETGHLMVYDMTAGKYVPKTVDLHQSTGSSKTGAMSQYAITKALNEINNVLFTQYTALTFSRTPSVIERGVNTVVTLTWNPTFNGAYEKPSALTVKKGDTTLTTDTSLKTIQDTEGITETTAYSIEATIRGIKKTASATVNAYYPQFAGAGQQGRRSIGRPYRHDGGRAGRIFLVRGPRELHNHVDQDGRLRRVAERRRYGRRGWPRKLQVLPLGQAAERGKLYV